LPPQKIRGIILQSRDYTETSKLVNFLTPEQGLLKTLAKGARRSTSPLRGKLELLNYGTLVFYPSRSSDLHLLAQFDLLIPFPEALNTLEKSAFFHYLAELASSAAYGLIRALVPHVTERLQDPRVLSGAPLVRDPLPPSSRGTASSRSLFKVPEITEVRRPVFSQEIELVLPGLRRIRR